MSLVSNFAGGISPLQALKQLHNTINDFDINDQTFSNILNEKIMGMDTSMNYNGINISDLQNNKKLDNVQTDFKTDKSSAGDMTTSEVLTFTKSLFDASDMRNSIYNFSRKSATNFYNKYSKNIATNLSEFVQDTIKLN